MRHRDEKILCVIPARGGSKGVPRKNLRMVGGHTLLARSVAVALGTKAPMRVVVNTDDDDIAIDAIRAGAEVVRRPEALGANTSSSESVLLQSLESLEASEGWVPDLLVFLQCTAPLTVSGDVDATIDTLRSENADSAFAAVATHSFLWALAPDGSVRGINHDSTRRLRRQERPSEFVEAGSIYVMRVDGFKKHKHRFFGRTVLAEVAAEHWLEVDSMADLVLAEIRLKAWTLEEQSRHRLPSRPAAIIFDFDGVMTDDCVTLDESGVESVRCSRADGFGVQMLRRVNIPMLVISRETNAVVSARCAKLGIECRQAEDDKAAALKKWAEQRGLSLNEMIFVGNDVADLGCMALVGHGVAVADAHPDVLARADRVLSRRGGRGAVRELCDLLLLANGGDV